MVCAVEIYNSKLTSAMTLQHYTHRQWCALVRKALYFGDTKV